MTANSNKPPSLLIREDWGEGAQEPTHHSLLPTSLRDPASTNVVWHHATVTRARREAQNGHRGAIIWFTGLSGSGKSTLAHAIEEALYQRGCRTFVMDGDNVRQGLCGDLGFSAQDRQENIRRIGEMAKLFMEAGVIVLAAFISPYRADRERIRGMVEPSDFIEIFCDTAIEICEARDVKGIYKKARAGEISEFTGISSRYEVPENPELIVKTGTAELNTCVQQVIDVMMEREIITTANLNHESSKKV
ncbi:MAG: adenylyl-sulfate kinase [Desulfoarculaceae bacterium]|nr:adenylyl-sulfate kinase [Desulfoarculaceae bacterium]